MRVVIKAGPIRAAERRVGKKWNGTQMGALLLFWLWVPVLMAAPVATTTTLAVTANGVNVSAVDAGVVVTLTATVETGGKPVTLGQVNFCDATAKLCSDIHLMGTGQLNSAGKASLKFVPRAGTHSYKAEFIGSATDNASASTDLSLMVYGVTKTTIASSGSTGDYTLKATVIGQANDVAPAGDVQFRDTSDGNAVLATGTLGAGTPALSWTNTQNPATQPQPLSIVVGDFNGDGIPDLAIGTTGSTTGYLSILLGNGNGTFQAAKNFTGLPNNQAMVAAPFVNGGPLDILTVDDNASGTNNAALFVGNGAGGGTLGTPFSLGGIALVNNVAAADFNRDGNEDFVVTGITFGVWCFAPVLGNGNGTFGGPTVSAIGDNPLAVAVGAFNASGYPDIVVADSVADQVTIFENDSQGDFFPEGQANTGTTPVAMVTGDFNGDGYLDLAVVNNGSDNVNIFSGKGNDTLTAGATLPVGHGPTSIAVGDFNGDGIADLAVVNSGDKTVSILLGKGDGTFVASTPVATGVNPVDVVTGDFAGTGFSNLAVTNQDIASTTGSTLTVQAAQVTETATATATPINPLGTGTHLVDVSYGGDSIYNSSVSTTTSLNGTLATAATPVLSLAAGTYTSAQTVTLTDSTYGAVIYYTTNGTTPTTSSTKYTGAITAAASETIEAIAVAAGFTNSAVATAKYTIETQAAAPVFSPVAGTYTTAQSVKITSTTAGAAIYYTTNGTAPTTASTKYTAAVAVSASETLEAISVATGYTNSAIATAKYTINLSAATPVLSPVAGTYTSAQSVKITSTTTGAIIYYTTNGATPTTASTKYSAAIAVAASETIKAIAVASGYTNSAVASAVYVIETPAAMPVFSPLAGTYAAAQSVKITSTTTGATIYYTLNGTAPTIASTKYTAAISVSASETVKAIAVATGYADSAIASAAYVIESPAAAPVFSPVAGTYTAAQSVKITSATTGATIYYTTSGATPTTASTKYTAAITVAASETIKAIAVATGYATSAVVSAAYVIETPAATPVFSPVAGTYTTMQSVKITSATTGATIYYTINGATPTTASTKYTAAITVSASETIKAIAVAPGHTNSAVASAAYVIEAPAAAPVFSPVAGTYTATQSVKITCATAGATIYYTTNGATPTTASIKYTAAITVAASETIKAIAVVTGYTNSAVASAAYIIEAPAATPVFSPVAGTYTTAQSVKISSVTTGATIYYTTNGATPTTASTKYTAAITVSASETIKAIAAVTGYTNSAVASAAYVIEAPAATPVFSPVAGTYTTAQSVKISSVTTGATIYYTTNGATPTTASTKYTAAITVSASETIKAIAVATGYSNSAIASAAYVIEAPAATPVFSPVAGTYTTTQSVKITSVTTGTTIYYTTNGTTPTTASSKYAAAISVSASETIEAIAVASGYADSAVATAKYTMVSPTATPTFSVVAGTYSAAQSVQISDATSGATIYYTTNGATPTPASAVYNSAVTVSETEYLQAIAVAKGFATSPVASALYSIGSDVTATPVLSPSPGAYGAAQTVTIKDATPGAVITYSVGIGSVVNTYTYTGPFSVSSTEYIAYDAIAPGYTRSAALEGVFTIGTVLVPQFSPAAGSYSTAQTVNIYDITPTATIYYTTDGSTPTTASAVYTVPLIVTANETLRAIATATGLAASAPASGAYTIGKVVATPAFSLAPGSYTSAQSVAITDITPGATIYYTVNGTAPSTASTKYVSPIAVATSETIEAIATASGDTNSAIGTAAYTIGYPIETFVATPSGTNVLTIPVGGSSAFTVASENQSGQSYPTITVKTTTGANTSLPVQVTICETNPSSGQCVAAPAATVTVAPFASGATPTFSVFVTATAAIASSPNNEVVVLFTNPGGTVLGSASVAVVTD
jgi:hypothetical protein